MESQKEEFLGYCFDEDGQHLPPVHLYGVAEAVKYFNLQKPLHPDVMITDKNDFCVMEARNGQIVGPFSTTEKG